MSSPLPSDDHHLQPGDRVVDSERHVEISTADEPIQYLGVLIRCLNPHSLSQVAGFDVRRSRDPFLELDSSELGIIVRWSALNKRGLLEHRADPQALADSVLEHEIPSVIRPLSRLRSAEGALTAAEDIRMVYGDALRSLVDRQVPPPSLKHIATWLGTWDYSTEFDPATETLHVERGQQTCAVFADGSIVGEHQLRDDIEALIDQMP